MNLEEKLRKILSIIKCKKYQENVKLPEQSINVLIEMNVNKFTAKNYPQFMLQVEKIIHKRLQKQGKVYNQLQQEEKEFIIKDLADKYKIDPIKLRSFLVFQQEKEPFQQEVKIGRGEIRETLSPNSSYEGKLNEDENQKNQDKMQTSRSNSNIQNYQNVGDYEDNDFQESLHLLSEDLNQVNDSSETVQQNALRIKNMFQINQQIPKDQQDGQYFSNYSMSQRNQLEENNKLQTSSETSQNKNEELQDKYQQEIKPSSNFIQLGKRAGRKKDNLYQSMDLSYKLEDQSNNKEETSEKKDVENFKSQESQLTNEYKSFSFDQKNTSEQQQLDKSFDKVNNSRNDKSNGNKAKQFE